MTMPENLIYTSVSTIPELVKSLSASFKTNKTLELEWRKKQLRQLSLLISENVPAFQEALGADLGRNDKMAYFLDLMPILTEITLALENLNEWSSPKYVSGDSLVNAFDSCKITPQPLGVCLIIGTWNYPIQLALIPLASAIAAGNCAIVKPSEVAPKSAILLEFLLKKYLDTDSFAVVNGAVKETTVLLEQKFDHIFYTGNGSVGSIILKAASKNLTPVVLELGGKSPVYVDVDCDIKVIAKRIYWAKTINASQTCIAPDYILCHKDVQDKFIDALQSAELELFGKDVKSAPEYGRVVNASHFKRLTGILDSQLAQNKKSKVVLGGKNMFDESSLFMPLTVVSGVELNLEENPMMTGELFGPLLPIITVLHHQEAIDYINSRDKPLSVYVMTRNKKLADNFLNQTTSGCAMVNDLIMNMAIHELPFGGVGSSGMGSYHGKSGFDTFSHMRSVMIRPSGMEFLNAVRYPPFSPLQWKVILTALGKKVPMKDSFMIKFVGKLIKTFGPFVLFTAIGFGIGWFTRI